MSVLRGGGLLTGAAILIVAGLLLRLNLVDWLIDAVGLVLLIAGLGLGIVGVVKLMSGRGVSSRDY